MAGVHRLDVRPDIGDGLTSFANAADEVMFVSFPRLAVVESDVIFLFELVRDALFDDLARNSFAVDVKTSLRAFEEDSQSVGGRAYDAHFRTV